MVDEHAVFTLITDDVPTKLPIHRGLAPKCGVVTKMHFSLGGRLAVNGIQLGNQQLIITAVAVADPRLAKTLVT